MVEYAFLLVCVTGLAGGGMKALHGKTASTAKSAGSSLTAEVGGGGGDSGGSKSGGASSGSKSSGGGGGAVAKPKKPKNGPTDISPDDQT